MAIQMAWCPVCHEARCCLVDQRAEEFIRNNRGINDSKDLPREFLEGIYDEIARNEIKVKDRASGKLPTLSHAGACGAKRDSDCDGNSLGSIESMSVGGLAPPILTH